MVGNGSTYFDEKMGANRIRLEDPLNKNQRYHYW